MTERFFATVEADGALIARYLWSVDGERRTWRPLAEGEDPADFPDSRQMPNPDYDPAQGSGADNAETLTFVEEIVRQSRIPAEAREVDEAAFMALYDERATARLDAETGQISHVDPPQPTLEALRAKRALAINALRNKKVLPGAVDIDVGGGRIVPVDLRGARDQQNIQALVTAAQAGAGPFDFRGADDAVHSLTAGEMVALGLSVQAYGSAVYQAAWAHKDALAALSDPAAIEAYDIEAGWPTP